MPFSLRSKPRAQGGAPDPLGGAESAPRGASRQCGMLAYRAPQKRLRAPRRAPEWSSARGEKSLYRFRCIPITEIVNYIPVAFIFRREWHSGVNHQFPNFLVESFHYSFYCGILYCFENCVVISVISLGMSCLSFAFCTSAFRHYILSCISRAARDISAGNGEFGVRCVRHI